MNIIPITDATFREGEQMLDFVTDAAMTAQIELPTRQYVTCGQAVFDCEQVAVTIIGSSTGIPGAAAPGGTAVVSCPVPWQVLLEVAIVRCRPMMDDDGSSPSPEELLDAAKTQSRDTHVLTEAMSARVSLGVGGVLGSISYPPQSGKFMVTLIRLNMMLSSPLTEEV